MVIYKATLLMLLAEIRRHASEIREEEWTNTNEGVDRMFAHADEIKRLVDSVREDKD